MSMRITSSVRDFKPSWCGFHFSNSFAHVPDWKVFVLGQTIPIGWADNGLCGGMSYAACDFFNAGKRIPATKTPPSGGALYNLITQRLWDSFDVPTGVAKYLLFMSPALPDHETDASRAGLAPHGRAWVMIVEQWPAIKAQVDAGRLCPIGLITVKSADPNDLGQQHQVVVFGYSLDTTSSELELKIYDCNLPNKDDVTINLNISNPQRSATVTHSVLGQIWCFFQTDYSPAAVPPSVSEGPIVLRSHLAGALGAMELLLLQ